MDNTRYGVYTMKWYEHLVLAIIVIAIAGSLIGLVVHIEHDQETGKVQGFN